MPNKTQGHFVTAANGGSRLEPFAYAFVCSFLLGTYLLTMPPGYTFGETSLVAAACASFGAAQPPGFPLFVLSCAPFSLLAQWAGFNPAVGASLASAVAASAACGCLAHLLSRMGVATVVSCAVAATFGLSLTFWSQAIVQEAYALHVLLLCVALLLADGYCRDGGVKKLYALAAVMGLGLSNNWPLLVLVAPVPLLWLAPKARDIAKDLKKGRWAFCIAAFFLGLVPYLHMVFLPASGAHYPGISLPDRFFDYVVRDQFAPYIDFDQHPRWDERQANALLAVVAMLKDLTWLGGALGAVGIVSLARKWSPWRLAALGWGLLGTTYLLGLYRPFGFDAEFSGPFYRNTALGAHFFFAVPVAFGVAFIIERSKALLKDRGPEQPRRFLPWAALLLPALALGLHFSRVDRSADDVAMRYAGLVLEEVDEESLLLVSPVSMDYPLLFAPVLDGKSDGPVAEVAQHYLDRVGPKPDIGRLGEYLGREEKAAVITAFVPYDLRLTKSHGLYFTAGRFPLEESIQASDRALSLLAEMSSLRDRANSVKTRFFVDRVVYRYCLVASLIKDTELFEPDPRVAGLLAELDGTPGCKYAGFLVSSLQSAGAGDLGEVTANVDGLGDLGALPVEWQLEVLNVLARVQVQAGEIDLAKETLEHALGLTRLSPEPAVPLALLALHSQEGNFEEYARLRRRHPELDPRILAGSDAQCRSNLGVSCAP